MVRRGVAGGSARPAAAQPVVVDALAGPPGGAREVPDDGRGGDHDPAGRAARGAVWLAVNGVVVKGAQTVVLLALAALLAPEALGLVALGTLVSNLALMLSGLGTANALVYWRGDVERAARTAVTICALGGLLATACVWVAAPALSAALDAGPQGPAVMRGLALPLPLVAVAGVTADLLRRRLSFVRRIVPDSVAAVVGAVVAVGLALDGAGVEALVAGQVCQGVLTLLLSWVVHRPVRPGWHTGDARGLLSYGGPLAGANLLQLVQLNIDYVVVSVVLGAAALGQYSLAFRLAHLPYLLIAVVVTGAAFPYLCRVGRDRLGEAAEALTALCLGLVTPVCLGIVLLADHLVVLGEKWAPAVPVVALLGALAWAMTLTAVAQTVLDAAGRTSVSMALRLVHLVLLVVGLAALTGRGIVAVAVVQVAAAAATATLAVHLARTTAAGLGLAVALRPAVAGAAAMTVVLLALRVVLGEAGAGPSVATLALGTVLGLAAYVAGVVGIDRERVGMALDLLRPSTGSPYPRPAPRPPGLEQT